MSRPLQRVLDSLSALLLLSAVALVLWPASDGDAASSGEPPATLARAPRLGPAGALRANDTSAVRIVSGNIFSASRRAPRVRFVPPGAESEYAMTTDTPVLDPYAQEPVSAATPGSAFTTPGVNGASDADGGDAVPALFGIVSVDGVRQALLTLRAGDPARLFAVGDRHAGYRITAIDADRAVLVSSRGTRTLRLTRSTPRDSSETTP